MKKILLATTVLVGTAGFASAEVTLSGDGRMGITYVETALVGDRETAFNSRVRATIAMSSSTDSGLEFGGSFGVHDAANASSGTAGSVYISGAFGKLTMGDIDPAAQNAVGNISATSLLGNDTTQHEVSYLTGAGSEDEGVLYSYSASGFTGFLSIGQPSNTVDTYSLGASYATDTFTVAVGYEDLDSAAVGADATQLSASASATFSGVTAKAIYTARDNAVGIDPEGYGLSASYTMDAITVTGFYRQADSATIANDTEYFQGIGASYSLGGGANVAGGIANVNGLTRADLGVNFTF